MPQMLSGDVVQASINAAGELAAVWYFTAMAELVNGPAAKGN